MEVPGPAADEYGFSSAATSQTSAATRAAANARCTPSRVNKAPLAPPMISSASGA